MTKTSPPPDLLLTLPCDLPARVLERYVVRRRAAAHEHEHEPVFSSAPTEDGSPLRLALASRLARALRGLDAPQDAIRPGAVLVMRAPDDDDARLTDLLANEVWPVACAALGRNLLRLRTVRADADDTSASTPSTAAWLQPLADIERAIIAGAVTIVLLDDDVPVAPQLAPLIRTTDLRLPSLDGSDITAMLTVTDRVGDDRTALVGLPSDAALADMTGLSLAHAWAGRDAAEVVARLREVTAPRVDDAGHAEASAPCRGPRLAELHGLGPARDLLSRIVGDIADWRAGRLDWQDVGASMLLAGPPGVGKTSVAHAVATEIDGPVIDISYGTMQAAGHLGQTLAALRAGVRDARARAPCVVLIDEVDSLSDRSRGDVDSHGGRYMRAVTNSYLTALAELGEIPGAVVIMATNHPSLVDPALIRAGRVDHHVTLDLPDRTVLGRILAEHLGDHAAPGLRASPVWSDALDGLTGLTGADAAALAREAIASARMRERAKSARSSAGPTRRECRRRPRVSTADLSHALASRPQGRQQTPEILRRVATHEAGHAVIGALLGCPAPTRMWIGPRGAGVQAPAPTVYTQETAEAEIACLLAGRAAETIVLGAPSSGAGAGPDSDLSRATRLAAEMSGDWHLCDHPGPPIWTGAALPIDRGLGLPSALRRAVAETLRRAEARADDLVARHRSAIEMIAGTLVAERDLDEDRIANLLRGLGPARAGSPDARAVALIH